MKNRNRTGRQKYFSANRRCKACVYNGGKRRGERICLTDICVVPSKIRPIRRERKTNENSTDI